MFQSQQVWNVWSFSNLYYYIRKWCPLYLLIVKRYSVYVKSNNDYDRSLSQSFSSSYSAKWWTDVSPLQLWDSPLRSFLIERFLQSVRWFAFFVEEKGISYLMNNCILHILCHLSGSLLPFMINCSNKFLANTNELSTQL